MGTNEFGGTLLLFSTLRDGEGYRLLPASSPLTI
jgi:hypothetical protein